VLRRAVAAVAVVHHFAHLPCRLLQMVTSSPGGTILLRAISYSRRNGDDLNHHFESCLQQALFLFTDYSCCGSAAAAGGAAAAADNQ